MDLIATLTFEDVQLPVGHVLLDCSFHGEVDFCRGHRGTWTLSALRFSTCGTKGLVDAVDIPMGPWLADRLWVSIVKQYAKDLTETMEELEAQHYRGQSYANEHRLGARELV